jgi:hypothetical protein
MGGDDSHVVFGQKFPGEKGSVRLHCRDATASSFVAKVLGKILAHFHAVTMNITAVCGIDCLTCQDEFFVKTMSMLLTLLFTYLNFSLCEFGLSVYGLCFFFPSERLSNQCQDPPPNVFLNLHKI